MYKLNINTIHGSKHHRSCEKRIPHLVVAYLMGSQDVTERFIVALSLELGSLKKAGD
jgi:hypothetical protein